MRATGRRFAHKPARLLPGSRAPPQARTRILRCWHPPSTSSLRAIVCSIPLGMGVTCVRVRFVCASVYVFTGVVFGFGVVCCMFNSFMFLLSFCCFCSWKSTLHIFLRVYHAYQRCHTAPRNYGRQSHLSHTHLPTNCVFWLHSHTPHSANGNLQIQFAAPILWRRVVRWCTCRQCMRRTFRVSGPMTDH